MHMIIFTFIAIANKDFVRRYVYRIIYSLYVLYVTCNYKTPVGFIFLRDLNYNGDIQKNNNVLGIFQQI